LAVGWFFDEYCSFPCRCDAGKVIDNRAARCYANPESGHPGCSPEYDSEEKTTTMATNAALTKVLAGKKVDSVRQRETELDIDFTDGSTLTVHLSAATGYNDVVEYKG